MFDFANILFAGPCNRFCPFCIGQYLPSRVNVNNLDVYPPRGIEAFIDAVNRYQIANVVFTGTVTDPHLYTHEARLLTLLRQQLHPKARFSIHTNGVLSLRKIAVFNQYDRACISFPSFTPSVYEKMMGVRRVPDLARLLDASRIPVKVSCVVNEHNAPEIDGFIARCHAIGVPRLVVRKLFGETRAWDLLHELPVVRRFRGNPVMNYNGMEVTYWDFDVSTCRSLNLFADGALGTSYLLTETPELRRAAHATHSGTGRITPTLLEPVS